MENNGELAHLKVPLIFDHRHYVPCIRWKQGEYQALLRLKLEAKDSTTPLFEIPEIGWDFESQEEAKTIDEHLEKFGKRFSEKWSYRWAFVDLKMIDPNERMKDGRHPMQFVFDGVRKYEGWAIPVTGIGRDNAYQKAVAQIISQDHASLCLRVAIEEVSSNEFNSELETLLSKLSVQPEECHLVLDLEAPNFEPLDGFIKMLQSLIAKLPHLERWRTFTICGTSFPETMGQLKVGVQILKRYEWVVYKMLIKRLGARERKPAFGDYVVAHPETAKVDMRLVKPAASIRYTIDDAWYVVKGQNVRDHGTAQYVKHCAVLVSSGLFAGNDFSVGDEYVRNCALGKVRPGRLTTWRWVGTNHHIEKTVRDVASFAGF